MTGRCFPPIFPSPQYRTRPKLIRIQVVITLNLWNRIRKFLQSYFSIVSIFSHSFLRTDIPFPWPRVVNDEVNFHVDQIVNKKVVYNDMNPSHDRVWAERVEKAVFFGLLWENNYQAITDIK